MDLIRRQSSSCGRVRVAILSTIGFVDFAARGKTGFFAVGGKIRVVGSYSLNASNAKDFITEAV